jgi:hypothetical protein
LAFIVRSSMTASLAVLLALTAAMAGCGDSETPATGNDAGGGDEVATEAIRADPTPTDCGDLYLQRMERQLDKYPQSDPRVAKLRQGNREIAREACENNERASLGERPETWECAALEAKAEQPPYSAVDDEVAIECRKARGEE